MEIRVIQGDITQIQSNAVILNYFEDSGSLDGCLASVNNTLGGVISQLIDRGEVKGKFKEITTIYTLGKLNTPKLVIVGMGKKADLNPEKIRVAAAEVCKKLRQKSAETVNSIAHGVDMPGLNPETVGQAIAEGALLGTYTFRKYISKASDNKEIRQLSIIESNPDKITGLENGCRKGQIIAEATILARDLANEPANVINPTTLAENAVQIAGKYGLEIQVLERDEMQRMGMGGVLGVAQGSQQPPKFMVLRYRGKETLEWDIALVGKGITFDAGGISIKSAEGMGEMKGDMAGGASVLGVIAAIAQLKPAVNVLALIPATENMPSGTAMRPGDIIRIMNGKTVEIITTDAEGRLTLADAICYARNLGAKRIIDVATLTGSCHIALGDVCTGAFSNNQELVNQVIAAGAAAGECMWQLPMNDEYRELNRTDVADLKNSGGRYGGASAAAWFIREFAENVPWVHLDIAGTSTVDKERGYLVKGNTGIPCRTLINLVLNLAENKA